VNSAAKIVCLLAALSVTAPLCAQSPNEKLAVAGVRQHLDVPYVTDGHERQKLDLYLPAVADERPRPVIVRIHGGAWRHGDKSKQRSVANFVKQGYIGVAINYRFSQQALFPAQIEDCKAAIRWLRAHANEYGIDSMRIAVMGSSAGGHLAAMLGTAGDTKEFDVGENREFSSAVCAVVDNFGPADLLAIAQAAPNSRLSAVAQLLGGDIAERTELAADASPISYVTPADPPFLIIHGDADPIVPVDQSELLHAALLKAGVSSELHIVKQGGHGGEAFQSLELRAAIRDFLTAKVKAPISAP
jgi:acetyl esterase/lipase